MTNLTLKIKSYQEDVTYLTTIVPNHFNTEEAIELGRKLLSIINDGMLSSHYIPHLTPNIIRFEDKDGKAYCINNLHYHKVENIN
jgi:N-acetyl-anhydromuramyl-L-alanine amidase AmpD